MPFKNKEQKRKYQREWYANRRKQWIEANGPCILCGSNENLEVDHIDPNQKVTHKIWSFTESKRNEELAKCQVLCRECHMEKTYYDNYVKNEVPF